MLMYAAAGKRVLAMKEKEKEALSVPQSLALADAFVRCAPEQAGVLEALVRGVVADGAIKVAGIFFYRKTEEIGKKMIHGQQEMMGCLFLSHAVFVLGDSDEVR